MTYSVFGGTLNLALSIYLDHIKKVSVIHLEVFDSSLCLEMPDLRFGGILTLSVGSFDL